MKFKRVLLVIFMGVFLASCGSDNDRSNTLNGSSRNFGSLGTGNNGGDSNFISQTLQGLSQICTAGWSVGHFNTQSYSYGNSVGPQFANGLNEPSAPETAFIGINEAVGDYIIVRRFNGGQFYSVELGLCQTYGVGPNSLNPSDQAVGLYGSINLALDSSSGGNIVISTLGLMIGYRHINGEASVIPHYPFTGPY